MTATDLSIKMHSNAHYNSPSIFDNRLDKSFADIDWQAPWLCHLNQLGYISKSITPLSGFKNDPCRQIRTVKLGRF